MTTCQCPRCGAEMELDLPPGIAILGKPRLKQVPALIPAATSRLAERLRIIADQMERGDYEGPDGAVVLLVSTERRHLDYTNRFGLSEQWVRASLQRALEGVALASWQPPEPVRTC